MLSDDLITFAMDRAIVLAKEAGASGNYPIGSVVVGPDGVIAEAASSLVGGHDPTAHPEIVAIRSACILAQSRYLPGSFLVSTLEPCPMCTSAAIWAKMSGIVFAARQSDALAVSSRYPHSKYTFRQIDLSCSSVVAAGSPKLECFENVQRERTIEVIENFLAAQTKKD